MNLLPRSFGANLLVRFVFVVALAELATWGVVSYFNYRQAVSDIKEQLQQAATAFRHVVEYRNSLLIALATTAARNHEIKDLFVSDDPLTLASALESIRFASQSDTIAGLATDARLLTPSERTQAAGNVYSRLVAKADTDPRPSPTADGYGFLGGRLHSIVVAPVRVGPDIIGWLAIGFLLDHALAEKIRSMTGIELTFFDEAGHLLATTLPALQAEALADAFPQLPAATDGMRSLPVGAEEVLVATRRLPAGDDHFATLVLQYSLDEKLAPARQTQFLLLLVATLSLVLALLLSRSFARRLTRPINELVAHTGRIATGDYRERHQRYPIDELDRLSGAFDAMARGLAERDRVRAERDLDRDLLDKNVSPEVAAQLRRDDSLGGEEREVTILFADLRGFTPLSEHLPAPELITLLNRYFERMSTAIEAQGGVIDKFIGDAIMAYFGAPVPQGDAAARAVAAARAMETALAAFNAELAAEGRPPLGIGIGINTAKVVAGNIGSARRLNYSVIGDGVNVAARLESLTRTAEYRTSIIVSAATRAALPEASRQALRDLGPAKVKGRTEPVEIFAVDP